MMLSMPLFKPLFEASQRFVGFRCRAAQPTIIIKLLIFHSLVL